MFCLSDFFSKINEIFRKQSNKKYKCHICEKLIDESCAIEHAKTEEYLIKLIQKDHPQWKDKEPLCPECVEYYRRLMREGEL